MNSKKTYAAIAAALAFGTAALYSISNAEVAAADGIGETAQFAVAAEWAANWSNKPQSLAAPEVGQGMVIMVEELAGLSALENASFSDGFAFSGKAPLKIDFTNTMFIGKSAESISYTNYDDAAADNFDPSTGTFTFYVDADISAKQSDGSAAWRVLDDGRYARTIGIKSGTNLSADFNVILRSVEKKPDESTESSEPTESTESSEPTESTESSKPTESTESSKPTESTESDNSTESTESSNPTESTESSKPTESVESSAPTSDDNGSAVSPDANGGANPSTGIALAAAPAVLAAVSVAAVSANGKRK